MPTGAMRRFFLVAAVALALPAVAACDPYEEDIAAVQRAQSVLPGRDNDAVVREIAGARGDVTWKGGKAERYGSDAIILVTADIRRLGRSGTEHRVALAFINNRETRKVAFEQASIDGQPQGLLGGALALFLLQLD
jgi:hypothetical protein